MTTSLPFLIHRAIKISTLTNDRQVSNPKRRRSPDAQRRRRRSLKKQPTKTSIEDALESPKEQTASREDNRRWLAPCAILLAVFAALVLIAIFSMYTIRFKRMIRKQHLTRIQQTGLRNPHQRRLRRRGPQPLVCTLGELSPSSEVTFPEDGLCDFVLYTHITSLKKSRRTPHFSAFTKAAEATSRSQYGISLLIRRQVFKVSRLNSFVDANVKRNVRGFGMLGTTWTRETNVDFYLSFLRTIHKFRKFVAKPRRIKRMFSFFGIRMNNYTRDDPESFLTLHAPLFRHLQLLVYETHGDRIGHGAAGKCVSSFPTPRVFEGTHGEPSLQDGIVAIDTLLHTRGLPLFNVCLSFTLSAHRYRMVKDVDLVKPCRNFSLAAYGEVCRTRKVEAVKVDGEGVVVLDDGEKLVDTFDVPQTLLEKLPSVRSSLMFASPRWSFCAAMFHLEHGDNAGLCGEPFRRLRTVKNYLQRTRQ